MTLHIQIMFIHLFLQFSILGRKPGTTAKTPPSITSVELCAGQDSIVEVAALPTGWQQSCVWAS